MRPLTCEEVLDAGPQYALGILDTDALASVSAHLDGCRGCRHDLAALQESADRLLSLEETDGWVDDPCSEPAGVRPGRRKLRVALTLAAAAVLAVGTTLGPELSGGTAGEPVPLATAKLWQDGHPVGTVYFYGGRPAVLELRLDGMAASGPIVCDLVGRDGTVTGLGSFRLYSGRASWAAPEHLAPGEVSSVVLVDRSGHVVASTSLAA